MSQIYQKNTFGEWGKIAIATNYQKVLKHETKVIKDLDVKDLYQMWLGMRQLCIAISCFSAGLTLPTTLTEKRISKIASILGDLRHLDTLQAILKTKYCPLLSQKEQAQLERVNKKSFKKQRQLALKKVKKILNHSYYLDLKQDLQQWLEKPQYTSIAFVAIEEILPDLLLMQVSQLLLHPGWLVGATIKHGEVSIASDLDRASVEKILLEQNELLDDLRKAIERSHDNLALFVKLYSNIYQNYLKQLKDARGILGEIQDSYVLNDFLSGHLKVKINRVMPLMAEILREDRYQNWQRWSDLQNFFCNPQKRQELRSILQYPRLNLINN